jgi:hypothetical protein
MRSFGPLKRLIPRASRASTKALAIFDQARILIDNTYGNLGPVDLIVSLLVYQQLFFEICRQFKSVPPQPSQISLG